MWLWIAIAVYILGAIFTLFYNMHDMVFIVNPFIIARNVIFWPMFLPILITVKS